MTDWDSTVDVLVAGSGGGGVTGAYTAAREGLEVLLVEATDKFGGTTAYSGGGGVWFPCNPVLQRAGISAEALRHTGIAWLVRQGQRFSELAGLVGRPSAEALAGYADLAPDGPKRGLAEIEPLMPALRHG